jgi:centriolar protein POC1
MFSIQAHSHWVNSAEFSPDTRLICSGSEDRTVKLWDVTSKALIKDYSDDNAGLTSVRVHTDAVNSVKFHPDGTCVASGSNDTSIKIWDIRSNRLIQHYDAADQGVTSVAFHPNGRYLLSSARDATVKIWDLR